MRASAARRPSLPNNDRWFVSYADFITLLFALFVVLFAASQTDKNHAKALSQSIAQAFGGPKRITKSVASSRPAPQPVAEKPASPIPGPPKHKPDSLAEPFQGLQSSLADEIRAGSVSLRQEQRGIVVSLDSAAFFPSGESRIDETAVPTVGKVAQVLAGLPNALRLEGHTDSRPIQTAQFKSNWELSAARSISMLDLLDSQFGIARERMAIVGYADTGSIASNETEAGRSRNRRVDIVILSGVDSPGAQ